MMEIELLCDCPDVTFHHPKATNTYCTPPCTFNIHTKAKQMIKIRVLVLKRKMGGKLWNNAVVHGKDLPLSLI